MPRMDEGHRVLKPTVHKDDRGCFFESYNERLANKIGNPAFVQNNTSISKKGVIRGLHYQWDNPCGKLIRVVKGRIIDVIVDIRKGKNGYGAVRYFDLNEKNKKMLWVPPGYAHGFVSLSDEAVVCYMVTAKWNKAGEGTINPLDKDLNIDWKTHSDKMILSPKDMSGITFAEYDNDPKFI